MGNIVSNENYKLKNSELKNIIEDWALNNYDGGLNYNKNYNNPIKKLLQKRACCTRSENMVIALPDIDITNANNIQLNSGYFPVNIDVFDSPPSVNNCDFNNEADPDNPVENYYHFSDISSRSNY